jgi:hypothetical protein
MSKHIIYESKAFKIQEHHALGSAAFGTELFTSGGKSVCSPSV